MQFGMQMRPQIELSQRVELNDPDRERLEAAFELWEAGTKIDFSVPVDTLKTVFGGGDSAKTGTPKDPNESLFDSEWREQFVMISPADMARISDGEKFAVLLGHCIFVSTETPADYIPLGVLNLAAARRARDNSNFAQLLRARGLSADYARHYTATLTDVLAAQYLFRDKPAELAEFLRWRKSVERTDFFNDETVGKILSERLQTRARARQLHPTQRGRYAKRSFILAVAVDVTMTRGEIDQVVKDFGIAKADIIMGRLKDEPTFDVVRMVDTIDAIVKKIREMSITKRNVPKNKKTINLTSWQSVQAYLLTSDICGVSNILQSTADSNAFLAKPNAILSLGSLKDRLLYLSRKALARVVPERNDMAVLRSLVIGTQQLAPLVALEKTVPADDAAGNAALASVGTKRDDLNRHLSEAEALLAQYAQVERAFADLGAKEAVPGVLAQGRQKIQAHLEEIKAQIADLERYEGALSSLVEVRTRFGSLFAQVDRLAD